MIIICDDILDAFLSMIDRFGLELLRRFNQFRFHSREFREIEAIPFHWKEKKRSLIDRIRIAPIRMSSDLNSKNFCRFDVENL